MSNRTARPLLAAVALTVFALLPASAAGAGERDGSPNGAAESYPSHVIGAGSAQWDGRARPAAATIGGELALVPRRRIVNSPQGYPGFVAGAAASQRDARPSRSVELGGTQVTPATSAGNDPDWTAFAAGAGTVALLAAALAVILLAARRRRAVGLP